MNIGTASARRKEREQEALRLHSEGLSIKQSAERMGVSFESVRRYLRSNGVPFVRKQKPRGKKLPCGSLTTCHALLVMLFEDGCGKSEIASMCGCSESNVANYLIRSGMVRNKRRTITDSMKQEIVELASQGVSYYEIGEAYGMNHASVSRIARSAGIVRGKGGGCAAKANAERAAKAALGRMERVRNAIGDRFDIVEETKPKWFVLKCRYCGHEFERFVDLNYPTTCPECKRMEIERHAEERELSSVRRALVRTLRKVLKVKEREERERAADAVHVCKECGREFTMRELRESNPFNYSDNPTFCSLSCSRRYHGRISKHRRREEKRAGDCDLSLRELDERDNHTCYLCGRQTDWNDYRVDGSGNFVAGDMYPSMDHVIPLVAGGTHTHGNLRIAHKLCNALKGDRSVEEAMAAIAARLEGVRS